MAPDKVSHHRASGHDANCSARPSSWASGRKATDRALCLLVLQPALRQGQPRPYGPHLHFRGGRHVGHDPNIPLTILFISIAVAIGKSCNLAPDNNMMRSLCTLSAIAPALGGVGTPLGGAPNIVVMAVGSATVLGHDITFWEWSALGMPSGFRHPVRLFRHHGAPGSPVGKAGKGFSMPEGYLKKKLEALGPVSAPTGTPPSGSWWSRWCSRCSGPQIFSALGLEEEARMMTAPVIAVLMGASAFPRCRFRRGTANPAGSSSP